jgi:alpha-methylacyl-CoA racemase
MNRTPLNETRVLSLALNLPGPLAVAQLHKLGATVVKMEPPSGDQLEHVKSHWYQQLHRGQEVHRVDFKDEAGRQQLEQGLAETDLLITSMRPAALERLGLAWETLHARHPALCHVEIIGYPEPHENWPGHDLTYQARAGLVEPPHLPRTCLADQAGAERVVSAALALLLARERGQGAGFAQISLAEVAEEFAAPWREGLTAAGGILGGGHPGYHLYRVREGWIAVAALERHFWEKLTKELGLASLDRDLLEKAFRAKTADEWERWAAERELPLAKVRGC